MLFDIFQSLSAARIGSQQARKCRSYMYFGGGNAEICVEDGAADVSVREVLGFQKRYELREVGAVFQRRFHLVREAGIDFTV